MKFNHKIPCGCGYILSFSTYGDGPFPGVVCPECRSAAHLTNPLSVSVTAERLLYRSKAELEGGDYSLSIVIGTMAVESFLTRLFLKLKKMDSYATTFSRPTPAQEEAWEGDYPKRGGFAGRSGGPPGPADFVSKAITKMTFDEFVARNKAAAKIMAKFPDAANQSAKLYFQKELFNRRNKVAHKGYVNSTEVEAQLCHILAVAIISIL